MEITLQTILFWLFAVLGLGGGIGLILSRNPVMSAMSLILNFFSIAGLYLSLNAEFLAVIQILVYAGAVMVLFLFVIMLLNLQDEKGFLKLDAQRGVALILGLAFVAEMLVVIRSTQDHSLSGAFSYGKVEEVGRSLMTDFIFPFEIISVILIIALIGAIVVARKYTHH